MLQILIAGHAQSCLLVMHNVLCHKMHPSSMTRALVNARRSKMNRRVHTSDKLQSEVSQPGNVAARVRHIPYAATSTVTDGDSKSGKLECLTIPGLGKEMLRQLLDMSTLESPEAARWISEISIDHPQFIRLQWPNRFIGNPIALCNKDKTKWRYEVC